VAVDQGHDLLVHQAAQDHRHHIHGLGVGHAHALHELAGLAQALEEAADLGAAAVHHHRVDAHQLEQHHVPGKSALEGIFLHGVAAVLDDHRLAAETLDVWQTLREDMGDLVGLLSVHTHASNPV
jgi:hypothetical protein